MDKETKEKITKITSILKEIEVAEDTKKTIFPLLYKLKKLKEKDGVENWKLWFEEDKDFGNLFGKITQKTKKYIVGWKNKICLGVKEGVCVDLDDEITGTYNELPKEWKEYCKERDDTKSLQD